ncbi:hypothetical protein ACFL3A_04510 [Pseudomonadota bacterium]
MFLALLGLIVFLPDVTQGATEYATFESFYKEPHSIDWTVAALVALFAAAVIFFTGGTASPVVVAIGSWLGGTMGLSGAAATNAGLALLGGGSIASGGFGVVGGAVLLTAALSFGTDVVLDSAIGKAVNEYEYYNLVDQSKGMPTLPLPINGAGPDAYEKAMELLKDIDKESPLFLKSNQQLINRAIEIIRTDHKYLDADEKSKNKSLLSLLYFISNDYVNAKKHAELAIKYAREARIRRTLPAFIYATSSLYEEDFDFSDITNDYFGYSVLAEPGNRLIPVLFSIYLDRVQLRLNDDYLDVKALVHIFDVMESSSLEAMRVQNYTGLLSRYFINLKLEQQEILSLVGSSNDAIKESPKTTETLKDSLERYNTLVKDSKYVMRKYLSLDLDDDGRHKAKRFEGLLEEYFQDKKRLASLVNEFEGDQSKWSLDRILETVRRWWEQVTSDF